MPSKEPLARALPVRDDTGQIVKWFGTATNIDEQKRTEVALRQSQEQVRALMNSNIIGINISEGEQIVDTNDTFLYMTGYTCEDLREGRHELDAHDASRVSCSNPGRRIRNLPLSSR